MHWKLFFTIVAAIAVGYLIIRWLRACLDLPQAMLCGPKREIGFAAIMNDPATA